MNILLVFLRMFKTFCSRYGELFGKLRSAKELISYQIPGFTLRGSLVWFAAFKDHIGFYPKASGIEEFKEKLSAYEISKGTVRFPLDKPIPLDLIQEIVRFRVRENCKSH